MEDIKRMIERFGKKAILEAVDRIIIKGKQSHTNMKGNEEWLMFAKRHGIVGRGTKAMRATVVHDLMTRVYEHPMGWRTLETPYTAYTVLLKNGRREDVFKLHFKSTELAEILELLQ